MSQAADEKLDLFRWFGYTETEARFLYLVATHSGYFFLKHYADFLGHSSNKRTARLISKALKRNHIMRRRYEHGSYKLYHLHSRRLYAELGDENTSLRKIGSVNLARTRLLVTSFVVLYPDRKYLESTADKIAYFEQRGIAKAQLPKQCYRHSKKQPFKTVYFPDKFPVFVSDPRIEELTILFELDRQTEADLKQYCRFKGRTRDQIIFDALQYLFQADAEFGPWLDQHQEEVKAARKLADLPAGNEQVVFTFFDCGMSSVDAFRTWLERYKVLLMSLDGEYKIIYVASTEKNFQRAQDQFRDLLNPQPEIDRLCNFFRIRTRFEYVGQTGMFPQELAILLPGQAKYSGARFEAAFGRYKHRPSSFEDPRDKTNFGKLFQPGKFETLLLPF
jgi:hypothetical protein